MERFSEQPPSPGSTITNLESSPSSFRFPTPAVEERITTWIQDTMYTRTETPSDDNSLGGSAYEFVDTDDDSRDGNATESVASVDFGQADDVASLADTEQSEDSVDEENPVLASIPDLPQLDDKLEKALETPTIGQSSAELVDDFGQPLAHSIEFEEPQDLGAETISVKHTVADFTEEQTPSTLQWITIQGPKGRLIVTIRQTMTRQGLSTKDPLRILYVGSHSAKQDIIHKIASSVTASVKNETTSRSVRQSSQLYNVVPVSAFGSERTPEIELMHSSGYQIKVEDCISAQNGPSQDYSGHLDTIKLTLDDNVSYLSSPHKQKFVVEPHWDLPHIAIFYCSDGDNAEVRRTRAVALKFMSRHAVPSIVISHKQLFDRGQPMSSDQHSVHMCLESRDPKGRGSIIHQRLPIDLASFLNIDARQMNRNLAYLTGLYEPLEDTVHSTLKVSKSFGTAAHNVQDPEKIPYSITDSMSFNKMRLTAEWRALLPVAVLLLSVFVAIFTGAPSYLRVSSAPAISVNSKIMSAYPISTTTTGSRQPVVCVSSTTTATTVKTSTRTITVAEASTSNSLAIIPLKDLAKVAQALNEKRPANKSLVCSAEILGENEILIRIPSTTKLSWLAKEAMSVNITRGNITVDTQRAYSSEEGIILSLAKKDAYGILNISIVTTRKPKVNETFQVHFGTSASHLWQSLVGFVQEEAQCLRSKQWAYPKAMTEQILHDMMALCHSASDRLDELRKSSVDQIAHASEAVADLVKTTSLEAVKGTAIRSRDVGIWLHEMETAVSKELQYLKDSRKSVSNGLLKAQVQSKLLWLKLQGKDAEYQDYKRRASEAARNQAEKKVRNAAAETKSCRVSKRAAKRAARKERKAGKKAHV